MKITATTNFPQVAARIRSLGTKVYQQAAVSAMNRSITKARTAMSREIREEFNLSASVVNQGLRIQRANYNQGLVSIEATLESPARYGRAMNVIHFSARQTKAGVSIRIKRVGGRKVIKSAFIANKGRTVFKRTGDKRLPIEPVQTIAVPQMFNTKRIKDKVIQLAMSDFPAEFERQARYYESRV